MLGVWFGMGSSMGSIYGRFILEIDFGYMVYIFLRLVYFS